MTTRTPTRPPIVVPDLVGVRADHGIQQLRELGLLPMTWSAEVDDVNEAGVVLGLDPPAGSPVRQRAVITMSIAAHPDFRGHADETLPAQADTLVEPTSTGPEICDRAANSPAERRDDSAQLPQPGVLQLELW